MNPDISKIRKCFWFFLFFLLTEGIFRRWLFPGLSNVFLVARDPFVLYAVMLGVRSNLIRSKVAAGMMVLGALNFVFTLLFGHGNIIVAAFGVRITFLYFPFMYICASVLTWEDICKVGRIFVLLIIPMAALNIVQFFSPQSSFVNIGVGGDEEGAGFGAGAMGYFRPPGIFTFISALTDYYAVALSFLLWFILDEQSASIARLKKSILIMSLIAYAVTIPVSISRTHFVQSAYIIAFFLVVTMRRPAYRKMLMNIVLIGVVATPLLMLIPEVSIFLDAFLERFNGANESEGGLGTSAVNRTFGWLFRALDNDVPIFGFGDGTFSNFGLKMLIGQTDVLGTKYNSVADSVEMEWGRVICENGALLGFMVLFTRFFMAISLFSSSRRALSHGGNILAWMTMPYAVYALCVYQLKAPYNLGFMCIIAIACLVGLKYDFNDIKEEHYE